MPDNAAKVKVNANELSASIFDFQKTLASLPGRVSAGCEGEHPDFRDGQVSLALWFNRFGKEWLIKWSAVHASDLEHEGADYKPLTDAPLKIKLAAVKLFPKLIDAIAEAQDNLVEEIADAASAVKRLTSTVKASAKPEAEEK